MTSFFRRPSTIVILLLRVAVFFLPLHINHPSLTFILIRSHWTLEHVREVKAIDALDGNAARRLPPLLLEFVSAVLGTCPGWTMGAILLVLEFFTAYMLESIGKHLLLSRDDPLVNQEEEQQRKLPKQIQPEFSHIFPIYRESSRSLISMDSLTEAVSTIYFGSPFIALSGQLCFQTIPTFFFVASIYECVRERGSFSLLAFHLAVAAYLEAHHCVYLLPLILLWQRCHSSTHSTASRMVLAFVIWFSALHYLSYQSSPANWGSNLSSVYGWGFRNIQLSLSVHWYFAMQLFSRFRDYFGSILVGLPYVLVVPISIRLHRYPMAMVSPSNCFLLSQGSTTHLSLFLEIVSYLPLSLDYLSTIPNPHRCSSWSLFPLAVPSIPGTYDQ